MRLSTNGLGNWVWLTRTALVVFVLTLLVPTLHPSGVDVRWEMYKYADKIIHALVGFLLALMAIAAFPRTRTVFIYSMLILAIGLVELAQIIGPRSADFFDFLMGVIGIAAISLTYMVSTIRHQLDANSKSVSENQ